MLLCRWEDSCALVTNVQQGRLLPFSFTPHPTQLYPSIPGRPWAETSRPGKLAPERKSGRMHVLRRYEVFWAFPHLGCDFSIFRQRRRSSSHRFYPSQFQQHLFWTDRHADGDRNECRFDSCHRIERDVVHSALFGRNDYSVANFHHHLYGDGNKLQR